MRDAKDYKNTIEFAAEKVHNAWMDEKYMVARGQLNTCTLSNFEEVV